MCATVGNWETGRYDVAVPLLSEDSCLNSQFLDRGTRWSCILEEDRCLQHGMEETDGGRERMRVRGRYAFYGSDWVLQLLLNYDN